MFSNTVPVEVFFSLSLLGSFLAHLTKAVDCIFTRNIDIWKVYFLTSWYWPGGGYGGQCQNVLQKYKLLVMLITIHVAFSLSISVDRSLKTERKPGESILSSLTRKGFGERLA